MDFPAGFPCLPFNDRLGTYTVSVHAPFPRSPFVVQPLIRVRLHIPVGTHKFSVSLRAKYAVPFKTNTVLAALATHPFILFLTLPRILHEAAVLHYRRCLDVYKRPELRHVRWIATHLPLPRLPKAAIGWQHPTLLERRAAYRRHIPIIARRRARRGHHAPTWRPLRANAALPNKS
jgi:uncharacterized protein DUF1365